MLSHKVHLTHCLLLIAFVFASFSSSAQNNKINSLRYQANSTSDISDKVDSYIDLGKIYTSQNIDSAILYVRKASVIAKTNKLPIKLAESYIQLGDLYRKNQVSDSSMYCLQKAYDIGIEEKNYDLQLESLNKIGYNYYKKGKYTEAYNSYTKAQKIIDKTSKPELKAKLFNNLALWNKAQNNSSIALEYFQEALQISEKNKDLKAVGIVSSNIGLLYESLDKTDEALEYLEKSLSIQNKRHDKVRESYVHNNIGLVYENLQEYDKALEHYRQSLQLKEEAHIKKGIDLLYNNIAIIFKKQGLVDSASFYGNKSLSIRIANNNKLGEARTRTLLGQTYLLEGNTKKAEKELTKALQLAQNYKNLSFLQNLHSSLFNLYMNNKEYEKAIDHLLKANAYKDQIFNIEKEKNIAAIDAKYNLLNTESENIKLSHEIDLNKSKLKRYIVLGVALTIVLLAIVILLFVVARSRKKLAEKNKQIEQQAIKLQQTNSRLKNLSKFQESMTNMLVHDLKTPLNVIINYQAMKDMDSFDQLIQQSGHSMQTLIHNLLDVYKYKNSKLELHKENIQLGFVIRKALEEVSFLAKARNLSCKLELNIDFIIKVDYEIIKRVFVNLLTNAIKYTPANKTITLKIELLNSEQLSIQIHNPGPPIPEGKQELIFEYFKQAEDDTPEDIKSTGLGLNFCKIAVEAHNGQIGVKSTKENGVTFWFTLPNVIKETQLTFPNIEETRNWFY